MLQTFDGGWLRKNLLPDYVKISGQMRKYKLKCQKRSLMMMIMYVCEKSCATNDWWSGCKLEDKSWGIVGKIHIFISRDQYSHLFRWICIIPCFFCPTSGSWVPECSLFSGIPIRLLMNMGSNMMQLLMTIMMKKIVMMWIIVRQPLAVDCDANWKIKLARLLTPMCAPGFRRVFIFKISNQVWYLSFCTELISTTSTLMLA